MLRFLYEFQSLFAVVANESQLQELMRGGTVGIGIRGIKDGSEPFCSSTTGPIGVTVAVDVDGPPGLPERPEWLELSVERNTGNATGKMQASFGPVIPGNQPVVQSGILHYSGNPTLDLTELLQACRTLASTLYVGAFRNILNVGGVDEYFDIRTGQQFVQEWKSFKTGFQKDRTRNANRITGDIRRIFGFNEFSIDASEDSSTLQLSINEQPLRLDEVGSGLTQFIVVLANAATQNRELILIDEPELGLHPSLQLDFLTTLGRYAGYGVLFTTHSLGLARSAADRIYSVQGHDRGSRVRALDATDNLVELTGELSYAAYNDLGYTSILLVEGSHDVTTVLQWLRLYRKEHEILLIPLGGSSMITADRDIQLTELKRLNAKISVLIDSERQHALDDLAKPRQDFVNACRNLGFNTHVLDRRATENYLSERAIRRVKRGNYRALAPFESLKDLDLAWGKGENYRIAAEMTRDELADTDLGDFLASLGTLPNA